MKPAQRTWLLASGAVIALALCYASLHRGILVLPGVMLPSPAAYSGKRIRSVTLVSFRWSPVRFWAGSSCGCAAADTEVRTLEPFGVAIVQAVAATETRRQKPWRSVLDLHFNAGDTFWTERVILP